MKKEVPHQKENQKSQRSKVDIEARKPKRERYSSKIFIYTIKFI